MAQLILDDKFDDGEMDLSMCALEEVPIKQIVTYRNMWSLDLSNNHLTQLHKEFAQSLVNLTKLDLSRNKLRKLPENFGELRKLKHLDLYKNELQYLPLSVCQLINLQWLDLKDNPLAPAILEAAGDCQDTSQCQQCATNVIYFFTKLKEKVDVERLRETEAIEMANAEMDIRKRKEKDISNEMSFKGGDQTNCSMPTWGTFLIAAFFIGIILFLLTAVRYEGTLFLQQYVVEKYRNTLEMAPVAIQYPGDIFANYFEYIHSRIGNYFNPNPEQTLVSYLYGFIPDWF